MKTRPATTWRSRFAGWNTDARTAATPCAFCPSVRTVARLLLLLPLLAGSASTRADPGYYLVTVYDNQGQANIDFRYWTVKNKGSGEIIWPEIGIGYGVTPRWFTGVLASYIGSGTTATRPSNLQWQNDFMLTQGQYDIDLALHTLLIRNDDRADGNALEFGPALQTDLDRFRLNTNLIFEKSWGRTAVRPVQLKYQWQVNYRWRPAFQFGLQGFGEVGEWDRWLPSQRQSHRLGPVVSGTLAVGTPDALHYQFAYLDGKIYGRRGHMVSMRLNYTF